MKKLYACIAIAVLMVVTPVTMSARGSFNYGIKAGLNFTEMQGLDDLGNKDFLKTYTGFNVGFVFNFKLPLGFEFSPELLYTQVGQKYEFSLGDIYGEEGIFRSGALRLPLNLQWGFDIFGVVKPYVVVAPYIGAVLYGNGNGSIGSLNFTDDSLKESINRFQYGIGVGAGVYLWKLQVSFKWNWDLNPTFKEGTIEDLKFTGGELSLAYLF